MCCSGVSLAQINLKHFPKIPPPDSVLLKQYDSLARAYFSLGEADKMQIVLQKGVALAEKYKNERYRGIFFSHKADYFKRKYNHDSGLIYAQKALPILQKHREWKRVSEMMYRKSTFYLDRKDQGSAMKELDALLRFNEKYNEHSNAGSVYNLLSFTFRRLNDTINEKKYILKELELAEQANSDDERLYAFDSYASFLIRQNKFREAQVYHAKSYAFAVRLQKNDEVKAEILLAMGENLIRLKEYKQSLRLLLLAEKIALNYQPDLGWKALLSTNYSHLSALFLATGKPNDALEYARRSVALLEKQPLRYEYLIRAYTHLTAAYKALGHYKEALTACEQMQEIKQSLDLNKDREITKDIEAKYQLEKTEKEKELANKILQVRELELENEQKQGRILWISLVVLALSLGGGYWFFRKNQRYNHRISRKNQELERLNETKDKLFSIIGHDLRAPVVDLNNTLTLMEGKNVTKQQFLSLTDLLRKKTTSLQTILNNLLYWALSQRHVLNTNPQSIPLKNKMEEVLESLRGLMQEKLLRVEWLTDVSTFIKADENHVQIILYNIIHNAIKFSPLNQVINLTVIDHAFFVELKVTNLGNEFDWDGSVEALSRLSSQAGTLNEKGTGLGLLVCAELIKLNYGAVRAYPSAPEGTTLELRFPKSSTPALGAL
jgi:two-component system sensor histidine kinase/response regulator